MGSTINHSFQFRDGNGRLRAWTEVDPETGHAQLVMAPQVGDRNLETGKRWNGEEWEEIRSPVEAAEHAVREALNMLIQLTDGFPPSLHEDMQAWGRGYLRAHYSREMGDL